MSEARIRWISGPVMRAGTEMCSTCTRRSPSARSALLGEVIKLGADDFVAQIYEDTTGLKPGDAVAGTGQPLSIALGPGILGTICDGLLRPLDASHGPFIQPGARRKPARRFGFEPTVAAGRPRAARPIDRQDRDPAGAALPDSAGASAPASCAGWHPPASTPTRSRSAGSSTRAVRRARSHSHTPGRCASRAR